jgi:hypothetical protein
MSAPRRNVYSDSLADADRVSRMPAPRVRPRRDGRRPRGRARTAGCGSGVCVHSARPIDTTMPFSRTRKPGNGRSSQASAFRRHAAKTARIGTSVSGTHHGGAASGSPSALPEAHAAVGSPAPPRGRLSVLALSPAPLALARDGRARAVLRRPRRASRRTTSPVAWCSRSCSRSPASSRGSRVRPRCTSAALARDGRLTVPPLALLASRTARPRARAVGASPTARGRWTSSGARPRGRAGSRSGLVFPFFPAGCCASSQSARARRPPAGDASQSACGIGRGWSRFNRGASPPWIASAPPIAAALHSRGHRVGRARRHARVSGPPGRPRECAARSRPSTRARGFRGGRPRCSHGSRKAASDRYRCGPPRSNRRRRA